MSYTMFDRMGDAVYEALEGELDREVIERIWETEVEPILDRFGDAQMQVWADSQRRYEERKAHERNQR